MTDIANCRKRAIDYVKLLNDMMELIGDKRSLTAHEKAKLQEMMRDLKDRFNADNKVCNSTRRMESLSKVERDYHRAIFEASTRIMVKSNTHPIRSRWFDDLDSCHIDIDYYLAHGLGMNEE